MDALFEKDVRLLLLRKSTLFLFLIIGVIFTWEFSSSFSGAYLTMLGTLLALSTLSYDESDNCMEFLFTLPCTRKQYVMEKYLFVYGISFVAGILAIVIIIVSAMVKGIPITASTIIEAIVSELPILVMTGGIMIPLQMKFGPEKARMVLLTLMGLVFAGAFMIAKITDIDNLLENIADAANSMNSLKLMIFGGIILIVLSFVSILISMKIMENKEY